MNIRYIIAKQAPSGQNSTTLSRIARQKLYAHYRSRCRFVKQPCPILLYPVFPCTYLFFFDLYRTEICWLFSSVSPMRVLPNKVAPRFKVATWIKYTAQTLRLYDGLRQCRERVLHIFRLLQPVCLFASCCLVGAGQN